MCSFAKQALQDYAGPVELTLRMVDTVEMSMLNESFRKKKGPTNVLAFPLYIPLKNEEIPLIGDIVICVDIVLQEAQEQHKTVHAHVAHMIVHGILHLLGFDHETKAEALVMETRETKILGEIGIADPYQMMEQTGK